MKNAHKVSSILQDAGFKAYVVGGAVRDAIMGQEPKDWDIATDATPEQVTALFKDYKVIPTGIVTFSSTIEEDLSRRDFTCNAIAWDIVNCEFVDPYNGRKDIADNVLRRVEDA